LPFPPPPPTSVLLVNDGTGQSYTYETTYIPDNTADYLAQLNAEGAKGYLYQGQRDWLARCPIPPSSICSTLLFRKDSGSSATYTYAIDPTALTSAAMFVQQANGFGQSGYLFYDRTNDGYLYIKDNTSSATYAYETPNLAQTASSDARLALYNSEGARGYLLWFSMVSFGYESAPVFVRDQTQAAVYGYQPGTATFSDLTALMNEANSHGAQGSAYYLGWYVKASNCSGNVLCKSLGFPG